MKVVEDLKAILRSDLLQAFLKRIIPLQIEPLNFSGSKLFPTKIDIAYENIDTSRFIRQ